MKALRHTALLLCIAFAAAADDDDTHFRAALVGTQETPAIFAAGSGIFEARVLNNDTRIEFQLTYEHLTAPPLVAHVHFGQRGVAGAVSFFLCGGGPAVQGIAPGDLAAILQMIRAGLGYANMHTPLHPGGEIRGQIRVGGDSERD
jgi:DNA-binding transcriptional LysR family regulator